VVDPLIFRQLGETSAPLAQTPCGRLIDQRHAIRALRTVHPGEGPGIERLGCSMCGPSAICTADVILLPKDAVERAGALKMSDHAVERENGVAIGVPMSNGRGAMSARRESSPSVPCSR